MIAETYWELMKDPSHWLFELTLLALFDGLIGALAWPLVKRWIKTHDRIHHGKEN